MTWLPTLRTWQPCKTAHMTAVGFRELLETQDLKKKLPQVWTLALLEESDQRGNAFQIQKDKQINQRNESCTVFLLLFDLFLRCPVFQLTTLLMSKHPNIVTKVTFKFGFPLFCLPAHEKCCIQVTVVPWLAAFSDRQGRCW